MEYLNSLTDIFENLKDHRTVSGISIALNEIPPGSWTRISSSKSDRYFKRYKEDDGTKILLLSENWINYQSKINSFVDHFTHYMVSVPKHMAGPVFTSLSKKLADAKEEFNQKLHTYFDELYQFEVDTNTLKESGELWEAFDHKMWYEACLLIRQGKRLQILQDIEDKVIEIQNALGNNQNQPDINFDIQAEKIGWLLKLGVIEVIVNNCKEGGSIDFTKAGRIIASFISIPTGLDQEQYARNTIIPCLRAIFLGNQPEKNKNHPLKSKKNRDSLEAKLIALELRHLI